MCLLISEIQVQTPCVSFNGDPEHDQSLSTRSSALCCSQDLGSLLVNSFATMDDNKKIQETRNLRSKIQIRVRKPQEIKKMKKEANCWVLDSNSNDIFPRVFPHHHQWLSQYGAVLSKLVLFMVL